MGVSETRLMLLTELALIIEFYRYLDLDMSLEFYLTRLLLDPLY